MRFEPPAWTTAKLAVKGVWVAVVALLVVICASVAVIRTVQLDGMRFLFVKVEGARPKIVRLEKQIADMEKAQHEATRIQQEVLDKAEQNYRDLAKEIDEDAEREIAAIHDSTERFIADNRLRCERVRSSRTPAAPRGDGAGVGEEVRTTPVVDAAEEVREERVAVTANDVRICTANTLQAEQAREWGLKLEELSNVDNP